MEWMEWCETTTDHHHQRTEIMADGGKKWQIAAGGIAPFVCGYVSRGPSGGRHPTSSIRSHTHSLARANSLVCMVVVPCSVDDVRPRSDHSVRSRSFSPSRSPRSLPFRCCSWLYSSANGYGCCHLVSKAITMIYSHASQTKNGNNLKLLYERGNARHRDHIHSS